MTKLEGIWLLEDFLEKGFRRLLRTGLRGCHPPLPARCCFKMKKNDAEKKNNKQGESQKRLKTESVCGKPDHGSRTKYGNPYTGPHKVLSSTDKTVTIDVNGRNTTVFL
ncbi:hypothetical protein TNCV_3819751 [Trichonephila clavipes]|nr:hypothetical protein TNCV_3819751 [Trichonephila clavipes]